MDHSKLFYVLNGLVNGEKGCIAQKSGGVHAPELEDGHYYLVGDDPDGHGPYTSVQEAFDAGQRAERIQTWVFPLDGEPPYRDVEPFTQPDANVGSIEEIFNGNQSEYFECSIEGSYETLTLRISCGSYEAAADVFRHTLLASVRYQ